jgi:hypothetical protein
MSPYTATQIRELFPTGMREDGSATYCPLGALGRFVVANGLFDMTESGIYFPEAHPAAETLRKLNPDLELTQSIDYAFAVLEAFDERDEEASWKSLDEALKFNKAN